MSGLVSSGFEPSGIVSLLTDFGAKDPYVGVMRGVLWSGSKRLRAVVDLTHELEPQDVRTAAFFLSRSWRHFPRGTVHVAVVDPGVGSERRILCALREGHAFLAPDNGLLGPVLEERAAVRAVDPTRYGPARKSRTFHGRDVFAPLAARLVEGDDPSGVGPPARPAGGVRLPEAAPVPGGGARGEVLLADRYGNLITNLSGDALEERPRGWSVALGAARVPVRGTYAEAAPGELLALVDSYDLIEIAVRNGSAARELGVGAGAPVLLEPER